ncbi:pyridoxamine 5'-phosphate oxidase family protein [Ruegeria sp. R14_0]|uniref:HugZ family pyridoxamine 5'-phosphate oxidase n=1 Tax=Ruegeria sp. R14_0 TaxID=2821100 RepID=UPI001AD9B171|nr:pyridoxamine 5'-phosphate oxidase family protein [Ruegeria sp. R14_0]MBO9445506.1 pyridoxamine 5'-phosphate oxidase family protein [Ruegeria sp. R14_0]
MTKTDPYRPVDETARQMAHDLIEGASYGALAVLRPDTALPSVSRVALATDEDGRPVTLISTLSDHTRALQANPNCALLVGEPSETGDPLTHPRLTLHATARFVARGTDEHDTLRTRYLRLRPNAKLYMDFADFGFVRFSVSDAVLNGGFGKAWRLTPTDIWPA